MDKRRQLPSHLHEGTLDLSHQLQEGVIMPNVTVPV